MLWDWKVELTLLMVSLPKKAQPALMPHPS